jgi:hypothetical protein
MAHIVLFLAIAAGTSAITAHFAEADYIGFLRLDQMNRVTVGVLFINVSIGYCISYRSFYTRDFLYS